MAVIAPHNVERVLCVCTMYSNSDAREGSVSPLSLSLPQRSTSKATTTIKVSPQLLLLCDSRVRPMSQSHCIAKLVLFFVLSPPHVHSASLVQHWEMLSQDLLLYAHSCWTLYCSLVCTQQQAWYNRRKYLASTEPTRFSLCVPFTQHSILQAPANGATVH